MALRKDINMGSTFTDIDEALYRHERAFYGACAGGTHFDVTTSWTRERERLTALWHYKRAQVSAPKEI